MDISGRGLVIGPSEGGGDVATVVGRRLRRVPEPQGEPRAPRQERDTPDAGYAHVNIWRLNDAGATREDTAARAVAAELSRQPGFRSYTLVRTGDSEVVAVTVFDTEAQARAAMVAVAPLVHRHVSPLADGAPTRRQGPLLHSLTA